MISEFNRNKIIDVALLDEKTLAVHGILNDSIYSLELDFKVNLSDLVCFEIEGRWLRYTTPECPQALNFLAQAEGFCLALGVEEKIHKTVGRTSCRHFANLLIECAYAVRETAKLIRYQEAQVHNPELTWQEFLLGESETGSNFSQKAAEDTEDASVAVSVAAPATGEPAKRLPTPATGKSGAFIIDMHMHTAPASPCASDSVEAMIAKAQRIGLHGICLTDHNYLWSAADIRSLRKKFTFPVFRANEIVTEQGDMLVYGFYDDVQGIIKLSELKKRVQAAGGFIVAAHPFRGFLTFGADDIGLTPEKARSREMFQLVDGVETLNGKVTATENGLAREVAEGLKLPATGGSDAHDSSSVGLYATAFTRPINNEVELLAALKTGDYQPIKFR